MPERIEIVTGQIVEVGPSFVVQDADGKTSRFRASPSVGKALAKFLYGAQVRVVVEVGRSARMLDRYWTKSEDKEEWARHDPDREILLTARLDFRYHLPWRCRVEGEGWSIPGEGADSVHAAKMESVRIYRDFIGEPRKVGRPRKVKL